MHSHSSPPHTILCGFVGPPTKLPNILPLPAFLIWKIISQEWLGIFSPLLVPRSELSSYCSLSYFILSSLTSLHESFRSSDFLQSVVQRFREFGQAVVWFLLLWCYVKGCWLGTVPDNLRYSSVLMMTKKSPSNLSALHVALDTLCLWQSIFGQCNWSVIPSGSLCQLLSVMGASFSFVISVCLLCFLHSSYWLRDWRQAKKEPEKSVSSKQSVKCT